jgi:hypothetical protein
MDPDPAIFALDIQDANKKLIFWLTVYFCLFFCLLLFEGAFTSFFEDKKSLRSLKN